MLRELRVLMTSLAKWLSVRLQTKWLWAPIPLLLSISVLNFSTESAKKTTIYDLLFFIGIYFPKYDNKHPSEMKK